MEIDFTSNIKGCSIYKKNYNKLLNITFKHLNLHFNPIVSVTIVDKETIHSINKQYRNIDRPTDVISFAFLDNEPNKDELLNSNDVVVLGDIYICYEVAKEHSIEYGNTLNREMNFLFVHGLLHLLGYDHMTKKDEDVMFPLQEEILKQ